MQPETAVTSGVTVGLLGVLVLLLLALVLGGGLGAALGYLAGRRARLSIAEDPEPTLPPGVGPVLDVLRSGGVVLGLQGEVVTTSPAATNLGLVRDGRLLPPELVAMVEQVRGDGQIRERQLELSRTAHLGSPTFIHARVAPLDDRHVLLLVEDLSQGRRVEQVRRDFVANVSHELKTPVGGMSILAEAIMDAKDDPEAVHRFAQRMQGEAVRLTGLIREIVELSRLQGTPALQDPRLVDIEDVVQQTLEQLRVGAEARRITLTDVVADDLFVRGDQELLITALRNLVGNAITYSEDGSSVGVGARRRGDTVEIAVTDQGAGIPAAEQERIFERFYRVDAARSRSTGGTGLGLSIVKHVCANHGGEVSVWSDGAHGSTFTMRLPAADPAPPSDPAAPDGDADPGTPHPNKESAR